MADLESLAEDFGFAGHTFAQAAILAQQIDDPELVASDVVARALWEAGVISYRRGFSEGRPLVGGGAQSRLRVTNTKVNELVADGVLSDADRAIHDRLRRYGDKHVAHRVDDDAEQADVLVVLSNPSGDRRVLGLGTRAARLALPEVSFLESASHVAERLHASAIRERNELRRQIMNDMAEHDVDDLYAHAQPDPSLRRARPLVAGTSNFKSWNDDRDRPPARR